MTFTYGTFVRPLGTCMDPEEYAYPAGSLRQSRRYGRALCSDGRIRKVRLGVADTFFSIPAVCKIRGRTVHGIVSGPPTDTYLSGRMPAETLCFYPHGIHRHILPEWETR